MHPSFPGRAVVARGAWALLAAPLVAGMVAPPPPSTVDCPINASAAFKYAMQRGDSWKCTIHANDRYHSDCGVNPLPSGELSFFGRAPGPSYEVNGGVFRNPLGKGWRVKSFTVTGARQVSRFGIDGGPVVSHALSFRGTRTGSTAAFFDMRVRQVVLTNGSGSCANVLVEAFER